MKKRGWGESDSRSERRPTGFGASAAPPAPRLRLSRVVFFALLHYLFLLLLAGVVFFVIHVPPKAVNLDGLILALVQGESVLTAPRKFLLWLWPGETTPGLLSFATTVLNSLVWGFALALCRLFWVKVRG